MFGTIGGFIMSMSFSIYGSLIFAFSIVNIIVGIMIKNIYEQGHFNLFGLGITKEKKSWIKKIHKLIGYIFGSLIYSSLFYRIYYILSHYFGYPIPRTEEMYHRPLDLFFQLSFYVIPSAISILYFNVKHLRVPIKCIILAVIIITVVLILL